MDNKLRKISYSAMFTVIIIVCTFIRLPIPYIPFTMQVFAVLTASLVLGGGLSAISVLLYITLGLIGLPIFSTGGGFGSVMSPSFGYMIGFFFGAIATGCLAKRSKGKFWQLALSCLVGVAVIYAFGLPYFYFITNLVLGVPKSLNAVVMAGFVVVLPGDIIKSLLAAAISIRLMPMVARSLLRTIPPRHMPAHLEKLDTVSTGGGTVNSDIDIQKDIKDSSSDEDSVNTV